MKKIYIFLKTILIVYQAAPDRTIYILILTFLTGCIMPASTYVWSLFINSLSFNNLYVDVNRTIVLLMINGILLLLYEILQRINRYNKDMQADAINLWITRNVFQKANELDMEQFDNPDIYNRLNKINSEALGKSVSIISNCIQLEENIVSLSGMLIIIILYNPIIAISLLLIFVPVFANDIKIGSKMHGIYESRIENLRLVFDIKSLLIKYENIKEIKIYQTGKELLKRIESTYQSYLQQDKKIRKNNLKKQAVFDVLEHISELVVGIYIMFDSIKRKISVGNIVMYINSVNSVIAIIGEIEMTIAEMHTDSLYMESLFDFLKLSGNENNIGKEKITLIKKIQLQNLYFNYPNDSNYILENINLEIEPKKSYLIVGLNGAGKTTLIKIICGIYRPSMGKMLINGIDSKNIDMESYRKLFGAVYQDFIHYPFNIKENIMFGNIKQKENNEMIYNAAKMSGALSYINNMPQKFETQLQNEWTEGTELSIGQWQKLAIARGFYAKALITILDEPTASLDAFSENEIYCKIEEFVKHTTCIVISHRLSIAKIVDKIIVLE